MDKNEHIDSAARKFKQVSKPNKYHYQQKFKSLPYWLEESSHYFKLEANKELIDHYYYYPRGSVISVNFGVNEGSEFSNLHFAVVLNKRDSPQNRTLTVIPLTSKPKAGRFSLGKEIFNQTSNILSSTLTELQSHLDTQVERNNKLEEKVKELEQKRQSIQKAYKETNKKINNLMSEPFSMTNMDDKKTQFSKLYKEMTDQITNLEQLNQKINSLTKESHDIREETRHCGEETDKLGKVVSIYKKYNKNTFARIEDITTISKLRIRQINEFDPSGHIQLSSEQMRAISNEIMKLYIS